MGRDQVRETLSGATKRRTRWTYAEFARLPSEGSTRHEVIGDQLTLTPAPSVVHQRIVARLFAALYNHLDATGLGEALPGPIDVLFGEGDYFEPDIVVVASAREHILSDRGVEGAPDLVVEVASRSTEARDRGFKRDRYRLFGVPEYWIVDPDDRSVSIWRFVEQAKEAVILRPGDVLSWQPSEAKSESTEALPPLEIDVGSLFGL